MKRIEDRPAIRVRYLHAQIAATALAEKLLYALSEDLQDGQVVERRLTIRNPFR